MKTMYTVYNQTASFSGISFSAGLILDGIFQARMIGIFFCWGVHQLVFIHSVYVHGFYQPRSVLASSSTTHVTLHTKEATLCQMNA